MVFAASFTVVQISTCYLLLLLLLMHFSFFADFDIHHVSILLTNCSDRTRKRAKNAWFLFCKRSSSSHKGTPGTACKKIWKGAEISITQDFFLLVLPQGLYSHCWLFSYLQSFSVFQTILFHFCSMAAPSTMFAPPPISRSFL